MSAEDQRLPEENPSIESNPSLFQQIKKGNEKSIEEAFIDLRENKEIEFHTCIIYKAHLKNKLFAYYITEFYYLFLLAAQLLIAVFTEDRFWVTIGFVIFLAVYGMFIALKGPTRAMVHYRVCLLDTKDHVHVLEVTNGKPPVCYFEPALSENLFTELEASSWRDKLVSSTEESCDEPVRTRGLSETTSLAVGLWKPKQNTEFKQHQYLAPFMEPNDRSLSTASPPTSLRTDETLGRDIDRAASTAEMQYPEMDPLSAAKTSSARSMKKKVLGNLEEASCRVFKPIFICDAIKTLKENDKFDKGVLGHQVYNLSIVHDMNGYEVLRGNCQTYASKIAWLFWADIDSDRLMYKPKSKDKYYRFSHRKRSKRRILKCPEQDTVYIFALWRLLSNSSAVVVIWFLVSPIDDPTPECEDMNIKRCTMSAYILVCVSIWILINFCSRLCVAGTEWMFTGEFSSVEQSIANRIGLMRNVREVQRHHSKGDGMGPGTVEWETDDDSHADYMCFYRRVSCFTYSMGVFFVLNIWFLILFTPLFLPLHLLEYKYKGWYEGVICTAIVLIFGTNAAAIRLVFKLNKKQEILDGIRHRRKHEVEMTATVRFDPGVREDYKRHPEAHNQATTRTVSDTELTSIQDAESLAL